MKSSIGAYPGLSEISELWVVKRGRNAPRTRSVALENDVRAQKRDRTGERGRNTPSIALCIKYHPRLMYIYIYVYNINDHDVFHTMSYYHTIHSIYKDTYLRFAFHITAIHS